MNLCNLSERNRAMVDPITVPLELDTNEDAAPEADARDWRQPLFSVEHVGETLVVMPTIRGNMFRYAQLQTEANALRRQMSQQSFGRLVLDLQALDYLGAEVIGAVVALARKMEDVGGRVVLCCAAPQLSEALTKMGLHRLWTFFPTREAALAAVQSHN
jgi:anti-anti-sigma factor